MLHQVLKEAPNKLLPEKVCAKIFKQIISAMDFFHARNIAHRDIKPENILVNSDFQTKVIDFGFAAQSRDKMQIFCGTPAYMSPEICAKQKYDGPAADVWASGILLYTMLFGIQPFKAPTEPELYRKIIKGTFAFPKLIDGKFEGFPEIQNTALIKSLLEEMLTLEEHRINSGEILRKY